VLFSVLCCLVLFFFVEESKYLIIEKELCTAHAAFTPRLPALPVTAVAGEILQLGYNS